ncbi:hypothetical protein B0H16DRAFT_1772486 [Mycena metata]|uniref:Uncharacterized protein n=1 Tax=Mycena metata TaxID=1033252 RepID=A0AAD7HZB2_9AGAR|nr:hypothetical protein B0H16DRAFT_1772486 [Mycena metata]
MSSDHALSTGPRTRPRLTHISIEALDAFLSSQAVEGSAEAVQDAVPRRSPRHVNTTLLEPVLPHDASLVSPPCPAKPKGRPRKENNHRIAPQVQVTATVGSGASRKKVDVLPTPNAEDTTPQKVTAAPRADLVGSGTRGKRGGAVEELPPPLRGREVPPSAPPITLSTPTPVQPEPSSTPKLEKKATFLACKDRATAAASLDDLAATFRDLISLMHDYRKSGMTTECFHALDAIQEQLDQAHEFPSDAESPESFSPILTKAVAAPIQLMSAQLQAQHKALQSLAKSVDAVKAPRTESYAAAAAAPHSSPPPPSPKTVPITSTPDARILLRCDGEKPMTFTLPYHELVADVNLILGPLDLPRITCALRTKDGGIFLVSESKEAVQSLVDSWMCWGPVSFPGARIVLLATYSHIQLDGILHAAAPDVNILAKEFSERYPELGPVVGSPTWVNNPPSEVQISATLSSGRKPRTAGSIFVRLASREKVDLAVSLGRLRLAGSAPTVSRGFPHLRVTQC